MATRKPRARSKGPMQIWLTLDGAPWRPFEDSGTLVKPQRKPRTQVALYAACEATLLAHLKAACLWPGRQRDKTWHIGDYSFYILEFSPARGVEAYLQFWSEPDEPGVSFEVSTGAANSPADKTEKVVAVRNAKDVRALAREAMTTLCKGLGYDGRQPLTFRLHLGTRLKPDVAFDAICASDLAKLMRHWGYVAEIEEHGGKRNLIRSAIAEQPFLVAFVGEHPEGSNEYGMIGLRAFLRFELGVPDGLANGINQNFVGVKASVDEEGDLIVQTSILLHGGVTEANLAMNFSIWRQTIEEIVKGLE
ncbi:MAG: YbjN domain-containing protein [Steroidobacteraceae bacterium]